MTYTCAPTTCGTDARRSPVENSTPWCSRSSDSEGDRLSTSVAAGLDGSLRGDAARQGDRRDSISEQADCGTEAIETRARPISPRSVYPNRDVRKTDSDAVSSIGLTAHIGRRTNYPGFEFSRADCVKGGVCSKLHHRVRTQPKQCQGRPDSSTGYVLPTGSSPVRVA